MPEHDIGSRLHGLPAEDGDELRRLLELPREHLMRGTCVGERQNATDRRPKLFPSDHVGKSRQLR